MKERPILFSSAMIRALLDGRKTQTRRLMVPQPPDGWFGESPDEVREASEFGPGCGTPRWLIVRCPYGAPGDRLWVRETWNTFDPGKDCPVPIAPERWGKRAPWTGCEGDRKIEWTAVYRADGELEHPTDGPARWKPSIFMPRWASRITLEITEVRVQRLQEISEDDARAEGCRGARGAIGQMIPGPPTTAREDFERLWDSINGSRRRRVWDDATEERRTVIDTSARWEANPWVWALTFRRLP